MAEHFRGRRLTVHTSNGGAKEMLNAWLVLGRRMAATDELDAVLAFLQTRIERGNGWKAFTLDPPPDEISSPSRITVFAQMVITFARELAKDQPDPSLTNISWDRDLRLLWLAKTLDLLEILAELVPLPADGLFRPDLGLAELEQVRCEVNRVRNRQTEALRRGATAETKLELADRMLELLSQLPAEEGRDAQLYAAHHARADLLLEVGDIAGSVAEMRMALEMERDPRFREESASIIDDLSR